MSQVTVNIRRVIRISTLMKEKILKTREQLFEDSVNYLMNRRFFPYRNRKKAEKKVFEDSNRSAWSVYNQETLYDIEMLIGACNISNSTNIFLSVTDVSNLIRWENELFPKQK